MYVIKRLTRSNHFQYFSKFDSETGKVGTCRSVNSAHVFKEKKDALFVISVIENGYFLEQVGKLF